MLKQLILITIMSIAITQPGVAQEFTQPSASVIAMKDVKANNMKDGRVVRRVNAATVGLMRVTWPKGAKSTPHNHAVELIITVDTGRLKAFSGGQEYILEQGDVISFPAWVDHGFEALEDTITYEAAGPG